MKVNMEAFYKIFLNMQMQQSLPIYQVNFPYKSQIYIDIDKSIVEFKFLKPKTILGLVGINFTM